MLGFPAGLPFIDQMPTGLLYFTGTMELIGGFLIMIGLFTRPVAFILSGFMAVGYFMAHFPLSFFPAINIGEPAVLFCFVFLYLAAVGSGPWAVTRSERKFLGGFFWAAALPRKYHKEFANNMNIWQTAPIFRDETKRGPNPLIPLGRDGKMRLRRFPLRTAQRADSTTVRERPRRPPARRPAGAASGARRARRRWRN